MTAEASGSSEDRYAQLNGTVGEGRYVLGPLLGEGGMAAVHKAHDTRLDRTVAIKTMHSELGREASFRQRFQREAQAVARLNHPNVVAVHDSGEEPVDGGAPVAYIVMEYVEGKSLGDVLREDAAVHGAMPLGKALKITSGVLAALDASHEHAMVHRDIKPANVMLTKRGEPKVMDFGIARATQSGVTSLTATGMMVGTPQYLSPEQAEGATTIDGRSDLYSVGIMLFQLLSGRLPFDGDSAFQIAYKHVTEPPPALSALGIAVPQAVEALISRALKKAPAERFPTAESMREEVERIRGGATGAPGGSHGAHRASKPSTPPGHLPTPPPGASHTPQPAGGYGYPQHTPPPNGGYGPPTPQPQPQYQDQQQQYRTPMPQQHFQTPAPQPQPMYHTPMPQPQPQYQTHLPQQQFVPPQHIQQVLVPQRNGGATASLVLGIISVLFGFILVGGITSIIGLVLGITGLRHSEQIPRRIGRSAAITGIVLNSIGMLFVLIMLIVIANS
jgi:serine/threonine-protein kinase